MRKILLSVALSAFVIGAYAEILAGNGRVRTETRALPGFSSISVSGSGTLRVHRGRQKVEITSDSNILPYVTTTVSAGELKIGLEPFTGILSSTKLQFDVTLPELDGVNLSGSGDAYVESFNGASFKANLAGSGGLKADLDYGSIDLNCAGSGGFDLKVKATSLNLRSAGSGDTFISGAAGSADVRISGSGMLGGRNFAVGESRIVISGSGKAEVKALKALDVSLSGSGAVRYWGNPSLTQRLSGSGRVSKAGD